MATTEAKTTAQILLEELRETRAAVKTLEQLAKILAAPKTEDGESFLQLMLDTQNRLVDGLAQVQASVQTLHRMIAEPAISSALLKAMSEG
jgi:DNA repair protein RadC